MDDDNTQVPLPADDVNPMLQITHDEKLPNDDSTPFSPPDGMQDRIDDTAPVTDTNVQPEEDYNEGIEPAAGVDLPGQTANEANDPPETR